MKHFVHREQAQLGLKYIEDAVIDLLTRYPQGLSSTAIAETLGLDADLDPAHTDLISAAVLEILARSGRVHWDGRTGVASTPPSDRGQRDGA